MYIYIYYINQQEAGSVELRISFRRIIKPAGLHLIAAEPLPSRRPRHSSMRPTQLDLQILIHDRDRLRLNSRLILLLCCIYIYEYI